MTTQNPAPIAREEKPKIARMPMPGNEVVFCGELAGDSALHAVVASAVGMVANLWVLRRSGSGIPEQGVPYDASGVTRGSWRWPTET